MKENKLLLFKELTTRLPYNVKVATPDGKICTLQAITNNGIFSVDDGWKGKLWFAEDIKPYLFPISSMSDDKRAEYFAIIDEPFDIIDSINFNIDDAEACRRIDWFNENHFDYRNLIEKGLAIDATNLNIY